MRQVFQRDQLQLLQRHLNPSEATEAGHNFDELDPWPLTSDESLRLYMSFQPCRHHKAQKATIQRKKILTNSELGYFIILFLS